jgi:hypothetical protein
METVADKGKSRTALGGNDQLIRVLKTCVDRLPGQRGDPRSA